jgi:oxygen-independent coproporphyrinogen-3 oxidase
MLCTYCDFVKYKGLDRLYDRFLACLRQEATAQRERWLEGAACTTLFFGGGTPSALGAEPLAALQQDLRAALGVPVGSDVCAELNPEDVDERFAAAMWASGFTRASLGIQCFDDAMLRRLGRLHSGEQAKRAVRTLRQGPVGSVSADLIYGLPGQSLDHWRSTLLQAIDLDVDHLSCYALTLEGGTPLERQVRAGRVHVASDDGSADMYDLTVELLEAAGFHHYEVSNWAKPGQESRHNLGYWRGHDYLGIGAGAVSCVAGMRRHNHRQVERYCHQVETTGTGVAEVEPLTARQQVSERLLLGLRTAEGLDLAELTARWDFDLQALAHPVLSDFLARKVLLFHPTTGNLCVAGRYWGTLHSVVSALLAALPDEANPAGAAR